jgi:hypothetical protein
MTFFNFLEPGKAKVSPWIWLYALVTVSLTVAIQVIWGIVSKRKEKQVMETLTPTNE